MKRVLFIFNPRAGKAQIRTKLMDIVDILIKKGYDLTIYPTQRYLDGLQVTKNRIHEFELLICSGGDGTLDEVVTGMMESGYRIPIGYIPAGSTNDFANSLKLPRNMIEAARIITAEHQFSCDVGSFNDNYFVYIAAFGIFTDVSYATKQEMKNILGHLAYVLEGAKRLYAIQSYWLRVESEGESLEGEFIFGMITNSNSVGGFKNMTGKNVKLDDGLFEVTLIQKPKNPIELQEIVGALILQEVNTKYIYSFKTERILLEADESIPWTLDGEFGGSHRQVEIINHKKAIQIMVRPENRSQARPSLEVKQ